MTRRRNDRALRVGIVGAGYIADFHVRAVRSVPGAAVVAVCDVQRAAAERFAEAQGIPRAFAAIAEMLEAERLDVAHVLVPPDRHASVGRTLVEAGVRVLFEKPLATTTSDCEALGELCRARRAGEIGTSHNFLFFSAYERLRNALNAGELGRIDALDVVWHKPLPQIQHGPFGAWMLADPRNILLEVGPHGFAHWLDLLGEPEELSVRASDRVELPSGVPFFRRWQIEGESAGASVRLRFSFISGYPEHLLRVRGTLASASVDFERNLFILHRHRPISLDFDRFAAVAGESASALGQATRTLADYALYKAKLARVGAPFQASITRSVRAFYQRLDAALDERQSLDFSRRVVALAERASERSGLKPVSVPLRSVRRNGAAADALVTGGTGFIGRALVQKLVERGHRVRVISRGGGALAPALDVPEVAVVAGSLSDPEFVASAISGVRWVFHLARSHGNTWKEFERDDVAVTRHFARICRAASVERFVYASSIAVYYAGARAGTIDEETPADPAVIGNQAYARAKLESERLLFEMYRNDDLPVVVARPGIVIGKGGDPRHWGVGMWPYHSVCKTWGAGNVKLPFVLVEDVADGLLRCATTPGIEGQSFNLVDEPCLSATDYLDELEKSAGQRFARHAGPIWQFYTADLFKWAVKTVVRYPERLRPSYRAWEGRTAAAFFDCSKARRVLGWAPASARPMLIESGIKLPASEFLT